MYIDPREHKRRTWRVVGRTLWNDVAVPMVVLAIGILVILGLFNVWTHSRWMILGLAGLVAVVWVGSTLWAYAEEKARQELKQEHTDEHWGRRDHEQ